MSNIITLIMSALSSVAIKLLLSIITKKMLSNLLFMGLEKISKSTTTTVDDDLVAKLKSAYYQVSDSDVNDIKRG